MKKQQIARSAVPEFEKEDRFKMNIVNCALLAAFVLNMPERPDVKRLTAYYAGALHSCLCSVFGVCCPLIQWSRFLLGRFRGSAI